MKGRIALRCGVTCLALSTAIVPAVSMTTGAATSDPSAPAPVAAERFPGGEATSMKMVNRDAFSQPSANLSFERELDFKVGNGFFRRLWVTAPASTQAADGLGPLYNARSCQRCHIKDGRGHPPEGPDDDAVSMLLRLSIPPRDDEERALLDSRRRAIIPEPVYGTQLQDFAIAGHHAEGRIGIDYRTFDVTLDDGTVVSLREPRYRVVDPAYGPLHPQTMVSPRIAPQMIGLGLLELTPEDNVVAAADPDDRDGDGVSGRPNRVWSDDHGGVALGRFGWKAGVATIAEQTQHAFSGDIGISVPLHPSGAGECTKAQAACRQAPDGNSPQYHDLEADQTVVDLVIFYARNLAVPARREPDHPEVLAGREVFHRIGCQQCHRPSFVTGHSDERPELSGQTIWPYSDLLLHDLGESLADQRPESAADGREWRTAPLWGIGLTPVVNGHSQYLHDGRARTIEEAILWHGGEAARHRDAYAALPAIQRKRLLRFVESL